MNIKQRIALEKKIVKQFIKDALAAGHLISVDNGGDEMEIENSNDLKVIMDTVMATDEERVYLKKDGKNVGWVYFVYGNDGYDVIADYTVNLEPLMVNVNKISEQYQ